MRFISVILTVWSLLVLGFGVMRGAMAGTEPPDYSEKVLLIAFMPLYDANGNIVQRTRQLFIADEDFSNPVFFDHTSGNTAYQDGQWILYIQFDPAINANSLYRRAYLYPNIYQRVIPYVYSDLIPAPDGESFLVGLGDAQGRRAVFRLWRGSLRLEQLGPWHTVNSIGGSYFQFQGLDWSEDRQWAYYTFIYSSYYQRGTNRATYRVRADGSEVQHATALDWQAPNTDLNSQVQYPTYHSSDRTRYLYINFTRGTRDLMIAEVSTGQSSLLYSFYDSTSIVHWFGNGLILVGQEQRLHILREDGTLLTTLRVSPQIVTWSPDQTALYLVNENGGPTIRYDMLTGETHYLIENAMRSALWDGDRLIFAEVDYNNVLWLSTIAADGHDYRIVTHFEELTNHYPSPLLLHPQGETVYVLKDSYCYAYRLYPQIQPYNSLDPACYMGGWQTRELYAVELASGQITTPALGSEVIAYHTPTFFDRPIEAPAYPYRAVGFGIIIGAWVIIGRGYLMRRKTIIK